MSRTSALFALLILPGLLLQGCSSDDPTAPPDPEPVIPQGYPPVPGPTAVDDFDVPDESEAYALQEAIAGKGVDFAPHWTAGTFTWDIDIQTVYETFAGVWYQDWDPYGNYWNGTRNSSQLRFEGGVVDLRNPRPKDAPIIHEPHYVYDEMPRKLMLVENGVVLDQPYNPKIADGSCHFQFYPVTGDPQVRFDQEIFVGYWELPVEPGFGQRNKQRNYYVAATAAPPLTNDVYILRERFWERVLVDETKSVRVDPGASKSVAYTRTTGTSYENSYEFARSVEGEASISPFDVGVGVTGSLQETFSESVTVSEEQSVEVTYDISGIEGKTIIFSVWQSVERYSFVDENGQPYTDPNYTFSDLGTIEIRGDHEVLQSAIFDYQAP